MCHLFAKLEMSIFVPSIRSSKMTDFPMLCLSFLQEPISSIVVLCMRPSEKIDMLGCPYRIRLFFWSLRPICVVVKTARNLQ
jgi:hypothetical protein